MEEYQFLIGFIIVAMVFIGYVVQLYRGAETTCDMVENLVEWFMTSSMNSKKRKLRNLLKNLLKKITEKPGIGYKLPSKLQPRTAQQA